MSEKECVGTFYASDTGLLYEDTWGDGVSLKQDGKFWYVRVNDNVPLVQLDVGDIEALRDHLNNFLETGRFKPLKSKEDKINERIETLPWVKQILSDKIRNKVKRGILHKCTKESEPVLTSPTHVVFKRSLEKASVESGIDLGICWRDTQEGFLYWEKMSMLVSRAYFANSLGKPGVWACIEELTDGLDESEG